MGRCGDCRFSAGSGEATHAGTKVVECRRRAPSPGQYTLQPTGWPMVPLSSWCGEFTPKGEDLADPIAAAAADLVQFIKDRLSICGHGTISATCAMCLAPWLPR